MDRVGGDSDSVMNSVGGDSECYEPQGLLHLA